VPRLELAAALLITLALVFYSLGVWAERIRRYLVPWHVASFWTGFFFDVTGTAAMELLEPGFNWISLHTITGQMALWLMFVHALWATRIILKGDEEQRTRFHRLSLVVWLFWLVPYFGGMYLGMTG
jgi:uncharacterized repeat protein (TIGR03987 family)